MKLLVLASLVTVAMAKPLRVYEDDAEEWANFKTTYVKQYKSIEDELKRKEIFIDNLHYIREHNAKYQRGEKKYYLGVNKFADMTKEEINSKMTITKRPSKQRSKNRKVFKKSQPLKDLPYSYDWSSEGAVTTVKDQLACSSGGWAFSATGSLEGQLYIKSSQLTSLSEQNLIDCSIEYGNSGCSGGSVDAAFEYVQATGAIDTELGYIFLDGNGTSCDYNSTSAVSLPISGYVDIESGDEEALQEAVYSIGPISAAINAQESDFIFYTGGVYDDDWCFGTSEYLNHYVLVTGWDYNYDDGDYWILKNSWGEDWGYSGYMYISQSNFNLCGIATQASYPELGSSTCIKTLTSSCS